MHDCTTNIMMYTLSQEAYCHCGKEENCTIINDTKDFHRIKPNTIKTMKVGLAKYGPMSCSINADAKTLRFYSKGVYNDPDHSSKEIIYLLYLDNMHNPLITNNTIER